MASVTRVPAKQEIEYPDSDGKPMSDHTLQYRWIVVIREGIAAQYADDRDIFVGANLLWYPVEGKPRIRGAPDVMVAFGRPQGERGSYKQWLEAGIAPHVVFEVLSPGNRPAEMKRKFDFYERHGVEEYYLYDPFSGNLEGWLRRGGKLKKIGRMKGFVSPRLGIRFEPGKGQDNLTIIGRDGAPFPTPLELVRQRAEARQRAETESQRAETESQRADAESQRADGERLQAETERKRAEAEHHRAEAEHHRAEAERLQADTERQRAERYAARLRDLGIEPD